jgi:RNA polymerase sigma-70 factor (ECF subfamily)
VTALEVASLPGHDVRSPADETKRLYEQYGQRIFTFCVSRLRDREEAQDAAQTAFMYAFKCLERGVVPEFELAWLIKIADNVCRTTRRSVSFRARRVQVDVDDVDLADSRGEGSSELVAALRSAVGGLPANQQRAILLREWQGLTYSDIADELEVSVAAVETLLFRARRSLARQLERVPVITVSNLASAGSFLRSLLPSWGAKAAIATAGVALVATPPAVYAVRAPDRQQNWPPSRQVVSPARVKPDVRSAPLVFAAPPTWRPARPESAASKLPGPPTGEPPAGDSAPGQPVEAPVPADPPAAVAPSVAAEAPAAGESRADAPLAVVPPIVLPQLPLLAQEVVPALPALPALPAVPPLPALPVVPKLGG